MMDTSDKNEFALIWDLFMHVSLWFTWTSSMGDQTHRENDSLWSLSSWATDEPEERLVADVASVPLSSSTETAVLL